MIGRRLRLECQKGRDLGKGRGRLSRMLKNDNSEPQDVFHLKKGTESSKLTSSKPVTGQV